MSTPVRRRFVLHACLGTALAMAACTKPKDDGVVAPDGGKGTPTDGKRAPVELAPVEHPAQLLPRGAALLVTGTSVTRAAEVLERDRLVQAFGPQYTTVRSVIVGSIGHDLLDPKAWPEVGLDPGGTVGFAVTNLADPRLVLLATVSDRTKVLEFVRGVAGKNQVEMVEEPYGGAAIVRAKDDVDGVVVLRDRFAALVFDLSGSGGQQGSLATARLLVTMDPNVSLASSPGYRKATGGLRAADVVAFLDVAGMVDQANVRAEQREVESSSWAQEDLARAKKEGASPERLAELERVVAEVAENEKRWRRQAEGERAVRELLASGIEGVGLTATSKRSGPVLDGRVVAGPEAFVRRLLANREGAPALITAMNGAPLWCGSGRIDPVAGYELAEAIAVADGQEPSAIGSEGKRAFGLDVQADLVPALAGDAELCLAVEAAPGKAPTNPKQLGFGAIVRTTDAAKAKYVLAKVATSGSELAGRMKKKGEGYTVDVDDWRTVHVQTAGDRVVVSTDADLAKRLAAGDPGSMPSKIRPPAAMGAMGLQGTAASQAFDLSLGVLWTMLGRSSMGESVVVAPGFTYEEMQKVPHSAKAKKAKKAMDQARARVEAIEAKREAAEVEQVMAITDGLGIVVTAATEDDRGFTLTGGQFLRAEGLGTVIEAMIRATTGSGPTLSTADQEALEEAWQRWSEAQDAYNRARLEDAAKAAKKLGKPPVVVPEIAPPPR